VFIQNLKILCGPKRTTFNCGFKISFNLQSPFIAGGFLTRLLLEEQDKKNGPTKGRKGKRLRARLNPLDFLYICR